MGSLISFPQQQILGMGDGTAPQVALSPEARYERAQHLVGEAANLLSDLGGAATELSWLLEDCLGLLDQYGRKLAVGRQP